MVSVITRDGKRQNRTLDINGFVKPSGTIVASVTNDRNETYFVQVRTDSTHTCKHIVNGKRVSCLGHFHTGGCYHVNAVKSAALPKFEEIDTTPLAEVMADADTAMRESEQSELVANDKSYAEAVGYASDPRVTVNAKTGMTDEQWTQYRYYLIGIGA